MSKNVAMSEHRLAYSQQEAAALLGCSIRVVREMIADGRLRTAVVGSTRKVTRASIDAVLGLGPS